MDEMQVSEEAIVNAMGEDEAVYFIEAMEIVNRIIGDPQSMVGNEALISAAKLAAWRTKIGLKAQLYKTASKSIGNRRRKDLLQTMYSSLEENINTLKLLGKLENGR